MSFDQDHSYCDVWKHNLIAIHIQQTTGLFETRWHKCEQRLPSLIQPAVLHWWHISGCISNRAVWHLLCGPANLMKDAVSIRIWISFHNLLMYYLAALSQTALVATATAPWCPCSGMAFSLSTAAKTQAYDQDKLSASELVPMKISVLLKVITVVVPTNHDFRTDLRMVPSTEIPVFWKCICGLQKWQHPSTVPVTLK